MVLTLADDAPFAARLAGVPLQARGVLREAAPAAEGEAPSRPHALHLPAVRDWVLDHSGSGAIWLVTDVAWYR